MLPDIDDLFSRLDLTKLEPEFLARAKLLAATMRAAGTDFYAICGFRTEAEQAALYAIGRTTETTRRPVTNAPPLTSFHNFGLAIDFCRDADLARARLQPDYRFADYKILADTATTLGLTPGYFFSSFPEGPHIQAATNVSLGIMQQLFRTGGLPAIWARISIG